MFPPDVSVVVTLYNNETVCVVSIVLVRVDVLRTVARMFEVNV